MSETTKDESSKLVSAEKKVSQNIVEFSDRKKREIEEWAEIVALRECGVREAGTHWDYFTLDKEEIDRINAARQAEFQAKVLKRKNELIDARYYWEEKFKLLTPYEQMVARLYLGFDKKTDYEVCRYRHDKLAYILKITREEVENIINNIDRKFKEEKDKNESKQ